MDAASRIRNVASRRRVALPDSVAFSESLLDQANVAVVPGAAFGADRHIRISFACSREMITQGLERITEALTKD